MGGSIAVIAGDSIGKKVIPEGIRFMAAVADRFSIDLQSDLFDFSGRDYDGRHG